MSEAFIVQPSEGGRLDLGGFEAVVLATSAQTSGDFSLLRTQNEPTGFSPPLHVHRDAAEAFYVLEGDYLVHIEDRQQLCPPGTFVYVPQDMPHASRRNCWAPLQRDTRWMFPDPCRTRICELGLAA